MIKHNNVELLIQGFKKEKDKNVMKSSLCSCDLGSALVDFVATQKANLKPNMYLMTYSNINKSFNFMVPSRFEQLANMSQIIGVEFQLDKDNTKTVYLDATAKVLGHTNRMVTVMGAKFLTHVAGGTPCIAYISDEYWAEYQEAKKANDPKVIDTLHMKFAKDKKEKIEFKPVVRVFDYEEEKAKIKEKGVKKGRPKKDSKALPEIKDLMVVRAIIPDGSLIVCDRILIKA